MSVKHARPVLAEVDIPNIPPLRHREMRALPGAFQKVRSPHPPLQL